MNNAATNFACAKASSNSGALEGTLDVVQAFGVVPPTLYFCAVAYATANGGALAAQYPAGSGPNIEPNEFLAIPTDALRDNNADGRFDRLDPALDFKIVGAQRFAGNLSLTWAAMPASSYQILSASAANGPWTNVLSTNILAGPLDLYLSWTETPPSAVRQRFYRVKLLP
jgi:hypothetical protein